MATGNTTLLKLALPVTGELSGTWGDTVNDSITSLLDSAVAGTTTLSADADVTLSDTALASNQARQAIILWTASNGATTRNITAPARSKVYIVVNAGTGSIVVRGAGPTAGVTVVAGERCAVAWNGSDFVKIGGTNGTGEFVTVDTTNLEVTNIKAKDGTASMSIADSTGVASFSANPVLSGGTANGVAYLNGSKVLTTGSALTFDGTTFNAPNSVITSSSSSAALRITQTGSGNALVVEDSANPDATPTVVDSAGNIFVAYGTSLAPSAVSGSNLQVNSLGSTQAAITASQWSAVGSGSAQILLTRSTSGTVGSQTAVSSGVALGKIRSFGSDGTNFIEAAAIESFVDGTPGTNDMPGRLVFSTTADGASSPTERMRLDSSGNLGLGATPSAWGSPFRAIQGPQGASIGFQTNEPVANMFANAYYDGSAYRYVGSGVAARFLASATSATYQWYTAPSGTAGNAISFTQAMTLDASGNLGVGQTSPGTYGKLVVTGGTVNIVTDTPTYRRLSFWSTSNGNSENGYIQVQNDGATTNTGEMLFATKNSGGTLAERARIDANGYLKGTWADKITAVGNTGTAQTLDLRNGNVFTATLTGNCTFTLSNAIAGSSFTLVLTNDATAGRTVAWAGYTFRFPGGASALGRTTTANATDVWFFFTPDGSTFYGSIPMKNLAA